MNIHHLELFYYVAKHKGIAGAVRNIPYGIQQPAISAQVVQLENDLDVTLFKRRPFELTAAGTELFAFIKPFFQNLSTAGDKIRGGMMHSIRIAASSTVIRDHMPAILIEARSKFPKLHPQLRVGAQSEIEQWLMDSKVDLGVTVLNNKPSTDLKTEKLLDLEMELQISTKTKIRTATEILKQDRITQTLISLPPNEGISCAFQRELARRKIDWPIGIELNALDLIDTYVRNGFGIGLSLALPEKKKPTGIRFLPLHDFPTVTIGVMWRGQPKPLIKCIIQQIKTYANNL